MNTIALIVAAVTFAAVFSIVIWAVTVKIAQTNKANLMTRVQPQGSSYPAWLGADASVSAEWTPEELEALRASRWAGDRSY